MNILAVVPARSGSRRLPHKNIKVLGDKPLVCWTIDSALEAKKRLAPEHNLDVAFSTDSTDYAKIVLSHSGGVDALGDKLYLVHREGALAEDCDSALVVKHAGDEIERMNWVDKRIGLASTLHPNPYDAFMLLQPTSPFRTWSHICACVRAYEELHNIDGVKPDSVFTVRGVTEFPAWMFAYGDSRRTATTNAMMAQSYLGIPMRVLSGVIAQELPKLYIPNGAVYISKRELIMKESPQIYGHIPAMVLMDEPNSIDIETEDDFARAEWLLARKKVKLE